MKNILFIFLLVSAFLSGNAADGGTPKQELLRNLALTSRDSSRLHILYQLTQLTKGEPDERLRHTYQMLKEAVQQRNARYECLAYLSYIAVAYNRFNYEEVDQWMKRLEPVARREKLYDLYFQGKQSVIESLMLREEFELEEKEALLMLQEAQDLRNTTGIVSAYHCLGDAYLATHRPGKALEVLEKAYQMLPSLHNEALTREMLQILIITCEQLQDYKRWLDYLNILEKQTLAIAPTTPDQSFNLKMMMIYSAYMTYYIQRREWEQADKYHRLACQYYSEDYSPAHKLYHYQAEYNYHAQINDLDKALEITEQILSMTRSNFELDYYATLIQKAKLLALTGKTDAALHLYKKAKISKDSIRVAILNKQSAQLEESYETDTLLLEKARNRRQSHIIFLILSSVAITALIYFVVHIYKVKQRLVKAGKEMKEMKDEMEQANLVKERFLSNINTAIRPSLNIIIESSSTLASSEEIPPLEKARLSTIVNTTSEQLTALINDILDLSKLEAGMMKFKMENFELLPLACHIAEIASIHKTDLSTSLPDECDYEIHTDIKHLNKIISSLLTAPCNKEKTVCASLVVTGGKRLKFTVNNTWLASSEQNQEIIIRNEINRMSVEYFGGRYDLHTQQDNPHVCLELPLISAPA